MSFSLLINNNKYLKMLKGCEIIFSGTVQGVGFRFFTRNSAVKHDIGGWVMNLTDGKVKLLAQGREDDLNSFINDLKNEFKDYINDYTFQDKQVVGDFKDFKIKFFSS